MRLGRRDPDYLRVGDALDFWRVEEVRRPTLLRLRAEMKVPGRAWLQHEVTPTMGGSRLVQTVFFEPKGLPGLAYWYALYPVHGLIFRGTVRVLAERASAGPRAGRRRPEGGQASLRLDLVVDRSASFRPQRPTHRRGAMTHLRGAWGRRLGDLRPLG